MRWLDVPAAEDYVAAGKYLGLLVGPQLAGSIVDSLRLAPDSGHRANDLLRAARLPLLGGDDPHVERDLKRLRYGEPLSPVLLVCWLSGRRLEIVDGYHRVCAAFHHRPGMGVPGRLVYV